MHTEHIYSVAHLVGLEVRFISRIGHVQSRDR
jgi:hypothetical protein